MAIDMLNEELLSLAEAAKVLPKVNGKRPAVTTIWRWARKGLRGVQLEYVRVGRGIATSKEALNRFFNTLAEADAPVGGSKKDAPPLPQVPTERVRAWMLADADRVLERARI